MIELDFLFVYEHKVRELENLCLMKYELDRRGYRTKIVYIDDAQNAMADTPIYHAKVLCTMACYDNYTLFWHSKEFVKFEKVIDLQWENIVYPKDEGRENAYKNYHGIGREVVHVSWGQQNVDRLIRVAHLDKKKVKLTGHVGMDFLRAPLGRYYLPRKEILSKYDIPSDKKVILFASPYYGDCLTEEYIEGMCKAFGEDWREYYSFMCASQREVLMWFQKICMAHSDLVVIYRPHPGHPSAMAQELSEKFSNFRIISAESVKQWILICDRIYTGNSSVVVEAFFAKKMCNLLFPFPTTPGFELKLISESCKIKTYEEFSESIYEEHGDFPTPDKSIEDIYLIDWKTPNYIKFADMAEDVWRDRYYQLSRRQLWYYKEYNAGQYLQRIFTGMKPLYNIYLSLLKNQKLKWPVLEHQREVRRKTYERIAEIENEHKHELTSEMEIAETINRIKQALEN